MTADLRRRIVQAVPSLKSAADRNDLTAIMTALGRAAQQPGASEEVKSLYTELRGSHKAA